MCPGLSRQYVVSSERREVRLESARSLYQAIAVSMEVGSCFLASVCLAFFAACCLNSTQGFFCFVSYVEAEIPDLLSRSVRLSESGVISPR